MHLQDETLGVTLSRLEQKFSALVILDPEGERSPDKCTGALHCMLPECLKRTLLRIRTSARGFRWLYMLASYYDSLDAAAGKNSVDPSS
eukprot:1265376-Pleurochrysis_carterae.AAC.3